LVWQECVVFPAPKEIFLCKMPGKSIPVYNRQTA
jgi:hypothetical protein